MNQHTEHVRGPHPELVAAARAYLRAVRVRGMVSAAAVVVVVGCALASMADGVAYHVGLALVCTAPLHVAAQIVAHRRVKDAASVMMTRYIDRPEHAPSLVMALRSYVDWARIIVDAAGGEGRRG